MTGYKKYLKVKLPMHYSFTTDFLDHSFTTPTCVSIIFHNLLMTTPSGALFGTSLMKNREHCH